MFRMLTMAAVLAGLIASADARTRVRSYSTKRGTQVESHQRTDKNRTKVDNWSSRGNTNPNTGKRGTVDPYKPKRPRR